MAIDNQAGARTALDAYTSLRQFNLAMWRALTPNKSTAPSRTLSMGD